MECRGCPRALIRRLIEDVGGYWLRGQAQGAAPTGGEGKGAIYGGS